LVYPDYLTLLIIYNSAVLFDRKRINIEIISSTNLIKKLEIPNHFTLVKGLKKGHLKMTWLNDQNFPVDEIFRPEDSFENNIIVSNNELKKNILNSYPVVESAFFDCMQMSVYRVKKDYQYALL